MARKSRGRLRLEMAKIEKETNLQVTFSKRRFGLFKKANELVTLCGAEVALIIFSPGQKVFSFGHPSVESIIERFFNLNINSGLVDAHRLATICQLTTELNHTEHLFDIQKKQGQILNQRMKNNPNKHCWEAHVDELSPQQLVELKVALEDLKNNVVGVVHKFMVPSANTNPSMLESGLFFGRNVAGYGARFNRTLPHYNSTMSMLPLPRASEASSSSMPWI